MEVVLAFPTDGLLGYFPSSQRSISDASHHFSFLAIVGLLDGVGNEELMPVVPVPLRDLLSPKLAVILRIGYAIWIRKLGSL
jgi:hypothetical protein